MEHHYAKLKEKVRNYLRKERDKRGILSRFISDKFFNADLWQWHRGSVSRGMGFGACCAIAPIPMQCLWAAMLCLWRKGNIPVAVLCSWISPPGGIVIITPLQWWFGAWICSLLGYNGSGMSYERVVTLFENYSWDGFVQAGHKLLILPFLGELMLGIVLSCILLGITMYLMTEFVWQLVIWVREFSRKT